MLRRHPPPGVPAGRRGTPTARPRPPRDEDPKTDITDMTARRTDTYLDTVDTALTDAGLCPCPVSSDLVPEA